MGVVPREIRSSSSFEESSVGGFAVFINYVSRRIHRLALMEAFSEYGKVVNVYIAYNNFKRRKYKSTFAFVRFSKREEADRAVKLGDYRKMDGFFIRVFFDKEMSKKKEGSAQQDNNGVKQKMWKNRLELNLKEGGSYRDALLTKSLYVKVEEIQRGDVRNSCPCSNFYPPNSYGPKSIPLSIPSSAQLWLNDCLVGEIKGMYDVDFVQQALRSDGFNVKVCCWSGFYAIIHFLEEEQKQIFWDLRSSLLHSWFSDIDTLENFRSLKKLKLWAHIERLPLSACQVPIITDIAGKWGEVIKVDEETVNRGRLDHARVLVGVSDLSDIPPVVSLNINGSYVLIKVLTIAFEDDRRWIDQDSTGVSDECLESCRFEDYNHALKEVDYSHALKEVAADSSSDAYVPKENVGFDSVSDNEILGDVSIMVGPENLQVGGLKKVASHEEYMVDSEYGAFVGVDEKRDESGHIYVPILNVPQDKLDQSGTVVENLVEVHVDSGSNSIDSSGNSGSVEPKFDVASGLFSIKPKWVRQGNQLPFICSRLNRFQRNIGISPRVKKSDPISGRKKAGRGFIPAMGAPLGRSGSGKRESTTLPSDDTEWDEAVATLEVCEALGIHFNADRQVILEKFVEMEKNTEH
ncbi:hypothetical protein GQ457_02G034280 [Hibiscus cannabinus]